MMPARSRGTAAQFGKYLLLDRIASGGMAELFLAKQTGLKGFEKVVAIKRILPLLTQDPEFVAMFINEAKLAALLSHQNIVQIFDLGTTEGFYYIAMEYVMGKDLRTVVQQGRSRNMPLPLGHALLIASRICSGLDYAHRKKDLHGRDLHLVHRDISPQNILISYEGETKLVDFGIAKATTQTSETRTGTLKGKLAYMSPEQAAGKTLDHRSDLFSLGIVLHELVTGNRLFTGANELALLDQVRQADIAPPSVTVPDLAPEVDAVIMRALAREPGERFQNASEMERALEEIIVAKGYAFSSLSLANHMHALFHQELTEDTVRLERIAELNQSTVVRPALTRTVVSRSAHPVLPSAPQPDPLRLTKRLLGTIALVGWFALLFAAWRPDLIPAEAMSRAAATLRQQMDRLLIYTTGVHDPSPTVAAAAIPATPPENPIDADRAWAIDALQRPPLLRQSGPGEERPGNPRRLYEEARLAYRSNNLAGAEHNLRDALSLNPQAPQGYHLLSLVLREQKKPDAAMAVLTDGLHRFPNDAELHHDLGLLYAEKNVSSLAVDELRLALSLEPSAPWADHARLLIGSFRDTTKNTITDTTDMHPPGIPPQD